MLTRKFSSSGSTTTMLSPTSSRILIVCAIDMPFLRAQMLGISASSAICSGLIE